MFSSFLEVTNKLEHMHYSAELHPLNGLTVICCLSYVEDPAILIPVQCLVTDRGVVLKINARVVRNAVPGSKKWV